MSFYVKKIGKYFGIPFCTLLSGCLESYHSSTHYRGSSFYDNDNSFFIQKIAIKKKYKNKASKETTIYPGDIVVFYTSKPLIGNSNYVELLVDHFGYVYDARYFSAPVKVAGFTSYQCQNVLSHSFRYYKKNVSSSYESYNKKRTNYYENSRKEKERKRGQEEADERLARQLAAEEYANAHKGMSDAEIARRIDSGSHIRAQRYEEERYEREQQERNRQKREQQEADERLAKQLAAEEYANAHKGMSDAEIARRIDSGSHIRAQRYEEERYERELQERNRQKREQEEADERLAKQLAAQEYARSQQQMDREELAQKIASDEHITAQKEEEERCKREYEEQERERKRKKKEQEEADERLAKQLAAQEYANVNKGMSDAEMAKNIDSGAHIQAQKQEFKKYDY